MAWELIKRRKNYSFIFYFIFLLIIALLLVSMTEEPEDHALAGLVGIGS